MSNFIDPHESVNEFCSLDAVREWAKLKYGSMSSEELKLYLKEIAPNLDEFGIPLRSAGLVVSNVYDWPWLEKNVPVFAQYIFDEYRKYNGMLPVEMGYVYLLHAVGSDYFKIGKSIQPDRRILQIKPAMPFKCEFKKVWPTYFMSAAEKYMHSQYSSERTNGEWFEFDAEDISYIFSGQDADWMRYAYAWDLFGKIPSDEYDKLDFKLKAECPWIEKRFPLESWVDSIGPMNWAEHLFLEIYLYYEKEAASMDLNTGRKF